MSVRGRGMPAARHARQHLQHPPGGLARLFHRKEMAALDPLQPLAHQPAGGGQPGLAQLARLGAREEADRTAQRLARLVVLFSDRLSVAMRLLPQRALLWALLLALVLAT